MDVWWFLFCFIEFNRQFDQTSSSVSSGFGSFDLFLLSFRFSAHAVKRLADKEHASRLAQRQCARRIEASADDRNHVNEAVEALSEHGVRCQLVAFVGVDDVDCVEIKSVENTNEQFQR